MTKSLGLNLLVKVSWLPSSLCRVDRPDPVFE